MKKKNLLTLFVILAIIILYWNSSWSQEYKEYKKAIANPKPITNSLVWENTNKVKVYNNCITALHLQGFELEPLMTSKESGLIVTRPANFYPPIWQHNWIGGEYYLNVLVYENDTTKISINIQIKGTKLYNYEPDDKGGFKRFEVQNGDNKNIGRYKPSEVWNGLTIKVSEDIEQFLSKLEPIQGKPVSKTTKMLNWE